MHQLLSSQVLTCVEATVRVEATVCESPRRARLSCSLWRPKTSLYLHTQLPLLVLAAIFPIGKVLCSHAKDVRGPTGTRGNLVGSQFVRVFLIDHSATASGIAALLLLLLLPTLGFCYC